jgi:hypothetical protein
MMFEIFQNIIYFFIFWYRYFFWYKNYHIKSAVLTLTNEVIVCQVANLNYQTSKGKVMTINYSDVKDDFKMLIRYCFKNQEYIYLTHKKVFKWPPERTKNGLIFNLPVKFASVVDEEGVEQYDVTEHIKKYAGPFNDFHEETILIKDIERYFPKLKLVNILDQKVILDTETDSIHHQTLWLPNKISTHQD